MSTVDNRHEMLYSSDMERKIGDKVETVNGAGVIEDIRDHRVHGGDISYLVCTGRSGFGGDRDIYAADEIW